MINRVERTYKPRVRKNSSLGKTEITYEIEEFNWEKFKNLFNAADFVEKFYESEARELARRFHANESNTHPHHFETMENVIFKTIAITEKQIKAWFDGHDWDVIDELKGNEKLKQSVKEKLIELAHGDITPNIKISRYEKVGDFIMKVCKVETDKVGSYLLGKLATKPTEYDLSTLDI